MTTATISYQAESLALIWDEVFPLLRLHKDEVAHYQDIELDPDIEAYNRAEELGMVRVFTVRTDGKLIGYIAYFVRPNMHYRKSLQAVQDVLFLHPDYRRGRVGMELIAFADRRLAEEGVQATYQHVKCKPGLNFGPLLERLGYECVDHIWAKRLDRGA
jgi:GNAT superfamily N-acetyltransferase